MGLISCLFLTVISAIACLSLPKLLFLALVRKTESTAPLPIATTAENSYKEVPSFL
ncbi:hypothetical protein H6G81_02785 [Scytonema hofmannii FACHB-248]|uniref:Uncharacterized protein n=1 Tax=Scytonema hofmannii FACHB-248 TaxID=1842502 RepID=A0ABR8GJX8_9CYAN|nr:MULTISPECIES: hypothetical protein [Nostocales]MBD2603481.1 hypothetical protein [Scytonema hofmannii FACHB-248]